MRKRVFSLILAICLMLTAFPVESMAADETSYGVMVGDKLCRTCGGSSTRYRTGQLRNMERSTV